MRTPDAAFTREAKDLESAYLQSDDPMVQSEFSGGRERWIGERSPLVETIDGDGAFLDVGCANGLLAADVVEWRLTTGDAICLDGGELADPCREVVCLFVYRVNAGNARTTRSRAMTKYLLSTYRVAGEVPGSPQDPEEMKTLMERLIDLEDDMESAGAFVFGGALSDPEAAGVASVGETLVTDGPFAESKEQIAGFYIIEARDDEEAQHWGRRVADATNHPIEIRQFTAVGRVKDMGH